MVRPVDFVETSMEIKMMSSRPHLEWRSPLQMSLGHLGRWQETTPVVMGVVPPVHNAPMTFLLELSVRWFKQLTAPSASAMSRWTQHHISMTVCLMFVCLEIVAKIFCAGPFRHMSVPVNLLMFESTLGGRTQPAVSQPLNVLFIYHAKKYTNK